MAARPGILTANQSKHWTRNGTRRSGGLCCYLSKLALSFCHIWFSEVNLSCNTNLEYLNSLQPSKIHATHTLHTSVWGLPITHMGHRKKSHQMSWKRGGWWAWTRFVGKIPRDKGAVRCKRWSLHTIRVYPWRYLSVYWLSMYNVISTAASLPHSQGCFVPVVILS